VHCDGDSARINTRRAPEVRFAPPLRRAKTKKCKPTYTEQKRGEIRMEKQTIFDAVQQIFRDNFDDDTLVLTRETCADDIEDWDSLEQINLLTAIEKKFSLKFKLEDVRGLKNVGDLLDLIERMAG
jgi:acyl carrier protein